MYDVPGGSCATGAYSGQPRRWKLIATDATEGSESSDDSNHPEPDGGSAAYYLLEADPALKVVTGREDELSRLLVRSPRGEAEAPRWLAVNAGLRAAATADLEERLTRRPSTVSALLERLTGAH